MKKTGMIFLLIITFAFTGCVTMDELSGSISAKVTSITSNVDPNIVAKVPEDKRSGFPKAEFTVKVGEEKLKLAQLKTELAAKQKKVTEYEEELVNIDLKDASLDYDIVKQEAIDATPGLGKKEDNLKALTSLKLKKNDLQGDRIKANGNIDSTKQKIKDITDKIKAQEEKIKELAVDKAKPEEKAAVSTEKEKADKDKVAEAEPEEKAAVSTEKEKADKGKVTEAKPEEEAPVAPAEKTK